jgi:hypothetical protein
LALDPETWVRDRKSGSGIRNTDFYFIVVQHVFQNRFVISGALKKMKAKFSAKPIAAAGTGEPENEKKND